MAFKLAPPDATLLSRSPPFLRLLQEASETLGLRLDMESRYGFIGRLSGPDGASTPIFGKSLGLNSDAAAALAADKDYTARWLAAEGLPTPPGLLVFSPTYHSEMALKNAGTAARMPSSDAARNFAETHGFPVIVKPNNGSEGRGIHMPQDAGALARDLARGFERDDRLRVEARIPGRDYRLLILDGKLVLAYERRPLAVTGDGKRPLSVLVGEELARLGKRHRGAKIAADDPRLLKRIAADGHRPETILPDGAVQPLLNNANLSTGGSLVDLTGKLPPEAESLAIRAAASLGLTVAGVDILCPDLETTPEQSTILEVNSAPGIDYFAAASPENWPRARAIVTEMLRIRFGADLA